MKFKKYNEMINYTRYKGFKAQKNKIKFNIAWDKRRNYYHVMIEDKVTKLAFNSIWRNITFKQEEIEKAFEFCELLADHYKVHRIVNISNCEKRIDDFLKVWRVKGWTK